MITDCSEPANDRRQLREDLDLAGVTINRLVRILASDNEPPAVARLINTIILARQDVDDALAELKGGQQ